MKNGIHQHIEPAEYYVKRRGQVSKSALDQVHKGAAKYLHWLSHETKETEALRFGRALHMGVLEPHRFAEEYVVAPDFGDCRYKTNKEAKSAWYTANDGKQIIEQADMEQLVGMHASVRMHPAARALLQKGMSEVTIVWDDPNTGLPCKSRADYYRPDIATVIDLKSTQDASPEGFAKSVANFRYYVQDALYRFGFAQNGAPLQYFALIAVEKEPPYDVAVYQLDTEAIELGYSEARADIERLQLCLETDRWHSYGQGIETLSLPRWKTRT